MVPHFLPGLLFPALWAIAKIHTVLPLFCHKSQREEKVEKFSIENILPGEEEEEEASWIRNILYSLEFRSKNNGNSQIKIFFIVFIKIVVI